MIRRMLVGAGVALAVSVSLLPGATLPTSSAADPAPAAGPPVYDVNVAKLPVRRAGTTVPHLVRNVLYPGTGARRTLPWSRAAATRTHLRLHGRLDRGWLLQSYSDGAHHMWRVEGDRRGRLDDVGVSEGEVFRAVLGADGSGYAYGVYDEVAPTNRLSYVNGSGRRVDSIEVTGVPTVVENTGRVVIVGTRDSVLWRPRLGASRELGVNVVASRIGADVLFVQGPEWGLAGPTTLSDPGAPRWMAPMLGAAVSPDGSRVIAHWPNAPHEFEVRDVATGEVLSTFRFRYAVPRSLPRWESDRSFVVLGGSADGSSQTLVRCTLAGACARVSRFAGGRAITYPNDGEYSY